MTPHPARPEGSPDRRSRILLLKTLVTVVLLGVLFWRIDLESSLRAIRASIGPWLLAAVLVSFLLTVISVLKWHRLLRALGVDASRVELLRLYLMGGFAGLFLPGVVGGDVLRWRLSAHRLEGSSSAGVAASILVERATGAAAVIFLSGLVLIGYGSPLATGPAVALFASLGTGLAGVVVAGTNRRWATGLAWRGRHLPIRGALRFLVRFQRALRRFSLPVLTIALGYGLLFYLGNGLVLLLLCRSVGVDLAYAPAFSAQVLTNLLALLPVSLSGLGLFQVGHVYFLGLLGVAAADSLAISLVKQLIRYGLGLVGGAFLLRWRSRESGILPAGVRS